MNMMASQITSFTVANSRVYSGADQKRYQSSASLTFVRGIHRWPVNSPHKGPVTRKMFPFDDVIMRDHSGHGLGQWENVFHDNAFSHWRSPCPEWSLMLFKHSNIRKRSISFRNMVDRSVLIGLTHWGLNKMPNIFKTIFSYACSWVHAICVLLKIIGVCS